MTVPVSGAESDSKSPNSMKQDSNAIRKVGSSRFLFQSFSAVGRWKSAMGLKTTAFKTTVKQMSNKSFKKTPSELVAIHSIEPHFKTAGQPLR